MLIFLLLFFGISVVIITAPVVRVVDVVTIIVVVVVLFSVVAFVIVVGVVRIVVLVMVVLLCSFCRYCYYYNCCCFICCCFICCCFICWFYSCCFRQNNNNTLTSESVFSWMFSSWDGQEVIRAENKPDHYYLSRCCEGAGCYEGRGTRARPAHPLVDLYTYT